jgi:rubrerythrin
MSMLDPLLRWIDPIAYRQKMEERRKQREAPSPERARSPLRCRICGYEGGPTTKFCPRCLAETMEAAPKR